MFPLTGKVAIVTDEDFDAVMLKHYTEAIERGDKITLPSQLRKSRALGTAEDVSMSRQSGPKARMRGAFLPVTGVLA